MNYAIYDCENGYALGFLYRKEDRKGICHASNMMPPNIDAKSLAGFWLLLGSLYSSSAFLRPYASA